MGPVAEEGSVNAGDGDAAAVGKVVGCGVAAIPQPVVSQFFGGFGPVGDWLQRVFPARVIFDAELFAGFNQDFFNPAGRMSDRYQETPIRKLCTGYPARILTVVQIIVAPITPRISPMKNGMLRR